MHIETCLKVILYIVTSVYCCGSPRFVSRFIPSGAVTCWIQGEGNYRLHFLCYLKYALF
jgi:hypothetical protein